MKNAQFANSTEDVMNMSTQPLIRLVTAKVVLHALDGSGADSDIVLSCLGLKRASFDDPDMFVHAMVMYQFLEDAAAAANDPHFVAKVGDTMDISTWPPLVEASKGASTVGSFLTAIAIAATDHSSSTEHRLKVHGRIASFSGKRFFRPTFAPAQIDAFFAAVFLSILRRSMGGDWRPQDVLLIVSDPAAIPPIFHGVRAIGGDFSGHTIRFPSAWLNNPLDRPEFFRRSKKEAWPITPTRMIADSVRQALKPHIGLESINNTSAARICRLSEKRLARRLALEGTTLGKLISELKRDAAVDMLGTENHSVAGIAADLGFSDPTSFTRAFKRWTGVSPRKWRKQEQANR